MKWIIVCVVACIVVCILSSGTLYAQNDTDLLEDLRLRMERIESENRQLHNMLQQQQFHSTSNPVSSELFDSGVPACCDQSCLEASCSSSTGNCPSVKNKYPTVKVTGFFQADAIWVDQQAENRTAIVNGMPLGDIQDGADFRRARLAATGDVWSNVGYMIEFDFAALGRPSFMDVYMDIRDLPVGTLRIGQWRQPFGLDALTSAKELTFMERALPSAFLPFRQIGAGISDQNEAAGVTYAASMFRYPTDTFGGNIGDNGGYGFSNRLTWLAIEADNNQTLHLGINYCFTDPSNNLLRFLNQPEIFVAETGGVATPIVGNTVFPPFVDTGLIAANNFNLFGTELAGTIGPLLVQSEFLAMSVNRIGASDVNFWGAYAQASYVLTGEVRPYSKKNGVYTRVIPHSPLGPCSGGGAWEIAGRWSTIDLTDENVAGNTLQDLTFGLNWYLNPNSKFQFNYIHPMLDSAVSGQSHADIFAVRAQLDF